MNLHGNTIFMTGGTSGIGLGLALRLRDRGNRVIISGRRQHLLDQLAARHDGIETVVLDVQDPESIRSVVDSVTREHPDLNVVITMAGIMQPENLLDPGHLAIAEATVATNLLGPIRTLTPLIPFLARQEQAAIITVSSGLAFVPLPATPTYDATKAAMHSYTESLRVQLADTSIQVIELVPPAVRTTLNGQQDSERAMPLEDFLSETMRLLQEQPDAKEILVDRVKPLRFATRDGHYDQLLTAMSTRTS
ncbi:SDR family oxidoreductase [Rhodococcus sp. X156]|uniref:SDR family oxidoreductase n=1 Tax=Rhodococcus sp. X156 TaxID=2499145 RepID=UPI000FDC37D0|nr:SDR family oxidoreductase [Rhodococcus sp. X156]